MGQEQVGAVRRRRTRAEVEQIAAEYQASGLNRSEFCRRRGLSLSTLNRYLKRQQQNEAVTADGASRWVAVELSGPGVAVKAASSGLAVVLASRWRIEVERGFDAGTLAQLLRVLEQV